MESSPGCWARYGELLARAYAHPEYMAVHQLSVDTYAVQHPGKPSRQSIQSVALHLLSLHAVLEQSMTRHEAASFLKACADKGRFTWLEPPAAHHQITVLHPLRATSAADHATAVLQWANAAWQAWASHHPQVRAWAAQLRA
jgi:hypothetical protein